MQLPSLPFASTLPVPLLTLSILFAPTYASTPRAAHIPQVPAVPLSISFVTESVVCTVLCLTFFRQWPGIVDLVVGGLLFNGEMLQFEVFTIGRILMSYVALLAPAPKETASMLSPQQLHGYYETVMSNPESRKIAYFLTLNLAYMGVQITYGIWTNSLGLISDGV